MNRERTDLDIPEGTVWPATGRRDAGQDGGATVVADGSTPIELGPGGEPPSLDPERDDAERNAAAGGWDGANEQIENDFEAEQLHRAEAARDEADEDVPLT